MIDPLTAIAAATSAFNAVQKLVASGQGIEKTMGQLGKWYGAIADLNEAEKLAENPPLFKKIVMGSSVEQEAMQIYGARKKAAEQEKQLRELLMYTYGINGYKELVDLRRKIKETRERTVFAQARRRKAFFWGTLQSILILCMGWAIFQIFNLIYNAGV